MITRYKIFENVQYAKKVLNELDIPQDDSGYVELKNILGNNLGYIGKFTEWHYKDDTPIVSLEIFIKS